MKTRLYAILGVFALATLTIFGASSANAAAVLTETYVCGNIHSDQYHVYGTCDGTWYNAEPQTANSWRSIRIVADISVTPDTDYRTTSLRYIDNLWDVDAKTVTIYCRYANGTSSAHKAIYTLGGGLAVSKSFSPYYAPCNGTSEGMLLVVSGRYCVDDGNCYGPYNTTIDINSDTSGRLYHRGVQITAW